MREMLLGIAETAGATGHEENEGGMRLKAPFPYFGGKSKIAHFVWQALGQPRHYIEPFFGSGAVLLARPGYQPGTHVETVNDKDGFIANVWRGIQFAPDEVARWCDWPINHADLCARRAELLRNEERLLANLIADPKWCDPVLAGYWIWAASCWIGSGLTRPNARPQLGGWSEAGVHLYGKRPILTGFADKGVHAAGQRVDVSKDTQSKGIHGIGQIPRISKNTRSEFIHSWMQALSDRLRNVRVVCGDWTQVCGGNWQDAMGNVGLFFDPPYGDVGRDTNIYHHDSTYVAGAVNAWVLDRGAKQTYRIVLAGYDEHLNLLDAGWTSQQWKTGGGYGNQSGGKNLNASREMLYFSPHCQLAQTKLEL